MRVHPITNLSDISLVHQFLTKSNRIREAELFNIGIHCGLRISDLLEMKFENLKRTHIVVQEKKTKKYRDVNLTKPIIKSIEVLKQWYLENHPSKKQTYLFQATGNRLGKTIKPISQTWFFNCLKEAAEVVNIDDNVGSHTLRKTYGYHQFKATGRLELIQSIFNHNSQVETLLYIGITREDISQADHLLNLGIH